MSVQGYDPVGTVDGPHAMKPAFAWDGHPMDRTNLQGDCRPSYVHGLG